MEKYETYYNIILENLQTYAPKLVFAILILVIGLWISRKIIKTIRKGLKKKHFDPALESFLLNLLSIGLKTLVFVAVLSQLGVATTSLAALLGAAGLAVGLSLQGSLSNFAGGFLIIVFKPFKIGDWIEAQGVAGRVTEIRMFTTHLVGLQNKTYIIPNGVLSNNTIVNFTAEGQIRVDIPIGISYESDIKKARDVLVKMAHAHPLVLSEPEPEVKVVELADSSVNISLRPYALPDNYWEVYFDLMEESKEVLAKVDVGIPFPQRVVHLKHEK